MAGGSGGNAGMDAGDEKLFTRRSLIGGGVLALFLVASLVFMGVSWNSGEYEKVYETLEYQTRTEEQPDLLEGVEYASQIGQAGSRVVYRTRDGRVLHSEVIKEPVEEVILRGTKSFQEVEEEVRGIIGDYCRAWQGGDHAAMVDLALPGSLGGATREDVEGAFAAGAESLASYSLGKVAVYTLDGWSGRSRGGYGGRKAFSSEPSVENAGIICEAELDLTLSSGLHEPAQLQGLAYAVFSDGRWMVQYFGPLKAIRIDEARDISREDYWSGQVTGRVTLEAVILYTDRFSLLLGEKNTTPPSSEPFASNKDGSLLRDVAVEISPQEDLNSLRDLCSDIPYDLERGASQRALFTYEPGLGSGDVLSVEVADTAFTPVKIP